MLATVLVVRARGRLADGQGRVGYPRCAPPRRHPGAQARVTLCPLCRSWMRQCQDAAPPGACSWSTAIFGRRGRVSAAWAALCLCWAALLHCGCASRRRCPRGLTIDCPGPSHASHQHARVGAFRVHHRCAARMQRGGAGLFVAVQPCSSMRSAVGQHVRLPLPCRRRALVLPVRAARSPAVQAADCLACQHAPCAGAAGGSVSERRVVDGRGLPRGARRPRRPRRRRRAV